jgi:hypothetical protein
LKRWRRAGGDVRADQRRCKASGYRRLFLFCTQRLFGLEATDMVRDRRETSLFDSADTCPSSCRDQGERGRGQPRIGLVRRSRVAVHPRKGSALAYRNIRGDHKQRLGQRNVAACDNHGSGASLREAGFEALLLTVSVLSGAIIVYVLKAVVGRARPDLWDTEWYWGSSFPSGHTLVVAALATATVISVHRIWPGSRKFAVLIAFVWAFSVGFSRLVLGVHWPTDVLAAVCIGMFLPLAIGIVLESWHA